MFAILDHDLANAVVIRFNILHHVYRGRYPIYNTTGTPWTPAPNPLLFENYVEPDADVRGQWVR